MADLDSGHSHSRCSDGALSLKKNRIEGIKIVFDTRIPVGLQRLEDFKSAFGEGYTVEENLSEGKVMLTILPGGAKGLL